MTEKRKEDGRKKPSAEKIKRLKREVEEQEWEAMAGPVTVRGATLAEIEELLSLNAETQGS
jgi:hypothetical protein